ncbi:MAG: VanZ family protein [Pseudomonadota bacterium]
MKQTQLSVVIARIVFVSLLIAVTLAFVWQVPASKASSIPYADKWVHFAIFFLLSLTLHKAFALNGRVSFLLLGMYGLLIEVVQNYIPGRGSDLYDWIADSLGVLAYFGLVYLLQQRKKKR